MKDVVGVEPNTRLGVESLLVDEGAIDEEGDDGGEADRDDEDESRLVSNKDCQKALDAEPREQRDARGVVELVELVGGQERDPEHEECTDNEAEKKRSRGVGARRSVCVGQAKRVPANRLAHQVQVGADVVVRVVFGGFIWVLWIVTEKNLVFCTTYYYDQQRRTKAYEKFGALAWSQ